MPRKSENIKEFKYGVISSVDEQDIPIESASNSLNVDGDVGEGILRGIPTDVEFKAPTGSDIPYIKQGQFIEHDGIYDLIYHDAQNNTISVITDFYGTTYKKKLNIISSLSSDSVTMTLQNKEVHIGIDGVVGYWVGRMDHGLFDYGISWAIASIADSSGLVRVTTTPVHSLKNGDIVKISGATGTDSASINGIWVISNINNINKGFDLVGSTYTGTTLTLPGTAELYLTYEYTHCSSYYAGTTDNGYFAITAVGDQPGDGYFQASIYYSWAYSLTYDGIQESPLAVGNNNTPIAEAEYHTVELTAWGATAHASNPSGLADFNKRITAINLYRSDSIDDTSAKLGLYRLVASIDINDDNWTTDIDVDKIITLRDYGNSYQINSVDYPGNPVTYTENSGMPEELTDPTLYYALSTAGSGYHFVTKCTQTNLAGSELRRIFKSKYFRYDMFDYYNDFLEMPEPVTALKVYEGKLFVFSLNKVYRINIEGFYIEDVYEDAGVSCQFAVHTNEYGMFFANFNNAWMYQGGTFYRIGDAIRQSASGGRSWATFGNSSLTDLFITSDAKKGYVLFINEYSSSGYKFFAWAYHPTRKRWDCFSFGGYASATTAGVFKGRDGEVYLSNATKTYKLMRPDSGNEYYTQLWEWYSQDFTFDEPNQNKSMTMIKTDATGTVTITYGLDGATPATSGTSGTLINSYNKSIKVKLNAAAVTTGSAYTNYVNSMEVISRGLIGKR